MNKENEAAAAENTAPLDNEALDQVQGGSFQDFIRVNDEDYGNDTSIGIADRV